MAKVFYSMDQLPLTLSAEEAAMVLGISRAQMYNIMHSEGFPTIRIGRRMVVSRQKLLEWIEQNTAK